MTEEEVKALLREASEKIKEDFIPAMTNLLMDVFQHGINKGTEIRLKISTNAPQSNNHCTIPWQTGEPKKEGYYLVTTNFGHVTFDYWMKKYNEGGSYYDWSLNNCYKKVRAWCKLRDIEPYKEEPK